MLCISDLISQSQTNVWCSSLALPPGKENPSLLSHGLGGEINKQRRLHTGDMEEMKIAKKQAESYHEWKCSPEQEENRRRRKLFCIAIIPEKQVYGCFKALGQRQLHSVRKQSFSLRNLPWVPSRRFKQNLVSRKKGTKGSSLLSGGGCLLGLKENEELFLLSITGQNCLVPLLVRK